MLDKIFYVQWVVSGLSLETNTSAGLVTLVNGINLKLLSLPSFDFYDLHLLHCTF